MRNVLEYLEAAYLKAPEKTAYASETDSLTFRQVYMQARSVGTVLLKDGLYKKPVVVFMEKSPQTITAFLGRTASRIIRCQCQCHITVIIC